MSELLKGKDGRPCPVLELHCPRCKRRLGVREGEAWQLSKGLVPYCADCLKEGIRQEMRVRRFRTGPINLRLE